MRSFRPDGIQSRLSDAQMLIQDHTQRIRGGWGTMALQDGMTIEKTFLLPRTEQTARVKSLTLRLPVAGTAFSFQMELNGSRTFTVTEHLVAIPLPLPGGEDKVRIQLKIRNVQGDPQLCFDTLRDYGRTQVDGKPVPCELVATLIEEFASDKEGRK